MKYGYGSGWFNPQEKLPGLNLKCEFERSSAWPVSFRDQCKQTAILIANQARSLNRTPVVLLSGGLDSEVVTKAFIDAEVDFRAVTFRYPNSLNEHELHFVNQFVSKNKFHHEFYEIDILPWIQSSAAIELFKNSHAHYFEMVPHMKLMLDIYHQGGFPVLGNGEALYLKTGPREWSYVEYEYDLAWYRFAHYSQIQGVMGFYQHTSDMTFAMMNDRRMKQLGSGNNQAANKLLDTSRQIKYHVYYDQFPDITRRVKKYDGGERLRPLLRTLNELYRSNRQVQYNDVWTKPVSEFFDQLKPKLA